MMYADTCEWTIQRVQNCLDDYSKLFAICQTPSIGSSWSHGTAFRTIPTPISHRFDLLSTKWALEDAVGDLSHRYRRIFRLRYCAQMTQKEIGDRVGCSRQQVFYILQRISQVLLNSLSSSQ